jgi:type I restriction enzyme M protein
MITGELRQKVDKLWDAFWSGGIANPVNVIEQITYLLFIKRLDEIQTTKEHKANVTGRPVEDPIFSEDQRELRWSVFKDFEPGVMFELVRDKVFPFMKKLGEDESIFARYMKGANFIIPTPRLLSQAVDLLSEIKMDNRDTKGDLYEYLLSEMSSAGKNGQFRTPRHIIDMMVRMTKPTPEDRICDPSFGTAGFLVSASEYIREEYAGKFHDAEFRKHFNGSMFSGVEFDNTMIRIGAMNLLLHGIENPTLIDKNALSEAVAGIEDQYSLILANPPFKGSLDYDDVDDRILKTVKTKKTELLFLGLMLRLLEPGGRCAVIVPDGVLFGSSNAHKQIREEIIEKHKLEAVISMPSGVFKPYAGVSTAVLFFTKTNSGGTDKVWFYDMKADGLSLDDKRAPVDANDIPDILERWNKLDGEENRKRTERSFFVPFNEIKENDWDLSINRYKEIEYEEVQYDPPKQIIAEIKALQDKNREDLEALEGLLG